MAFPDAAPLIDAHQAGCAFWWMRAGGERSVRFSPDVGPNACRAQRVEVLASSAISIGRDWNAHTGALKVPADAKAPEDGLFVLSVVSVAPTAFCA